MPAYAAATSVRSPHRMQAEVLTCSAASLARAGGWAEVLTCSAASLKRDGGCSTELP